MFVENHSGSLNPAVIAAEVEAAPRIGGHHPADPEPHIEVPPYVPTQELTDLVFAIKRAHTLRQGMIRAKNRIVLQGMAVIRVVIQTDEDYVSDAAKAALRERADKLYREAAADPEHEFHPLIAPYLAAGEPLQCHADGYAKHLERLAKQLPVAGWVKQVKGLGMVSFATIIGEAGDIGTYRGPACLWKRMGVAVIAGRRQGAPGEGASKQDWVAHGYRASRRSVSWNARDKLILGMGKWRPMFGEDVDANPDLTYFQRLFAKRVRLECEKLGVPVKQAATGKESYSAHAINRAMRYVEKRMLRHLYFAWRRTAAGLGPIVH